MRTLLKLYLPEIFRYCAYNAILLPASYLGARWLLGGGATVTEELGGLAILAMVFGWVGKLIQLHQKLGSNKEWMFALPMARWKVFALVLVVDSVFSVIFTLSLIPFQFLLWGPKILLLPLVFVTETFWSGLLTSVSSVGTGTLTFFYCCLVGFMCGTVGVYRMRAGDSAFALNTFRKLSGDRRRQVATGGLLLLSLALPYGGKIALLVVGLAYLFSSLLSDVLLAGGTARRTIHALSFSASVTFLAGLTLLSVFKTASPVLATRLDAMAFLGRFAPGDLDQMTGQILETALTENQFAELVEAHPDGVVGLRRVANSSLDLARAFVAQKEPRVLAALLALRKPGSVQPREIAMFVGRANELGLAACLPAATALAAVPAAASWAEPLIAAREPAPHCMGLILARYFQEPALKEQILQRFGSFRDEQKIAALRTLSVLSGRVVTFDQVAPTVYGGDQSFRRALASTEPALACRSGLRIKNPPDQTDVGTINRCIRARMPASASEDRGRLEKEHDGWLSFPFSYSASTLIRKYFP